MGLWIGVSQNAPAESYFYGSVISGQSFQVMVNYLDEYGNPDINYNETVTVYANSEYSVTGYSLGTIAVQSGTGFGYFTINSVLGLTDPSRKLTVVDPNQNQASIDVGVWFQVTMTVECLNPDYYDHQLACGQIYTSKAEFAALPCTGLCGHSVAIYSTRNGNSVSVPVQDVGPITTTNNYWNGTGVPEYPAHGIDGSDGTWDALGLSSYYQCSAPAYGSETVQWRFE